MIESILNKLNGNVWNTNGDKSNVSQTNWSYPYEGQCVSLIKAYFKMLFGSPLNFGNAIDYYNNMNTNGILNYCKWVTSNPQNGDIAVSHCYIDTDEGIVDFGHVMIYWNGNYLSQNVDMGNGANPKATVYPNYWSNVILGWFRPIINKEDYISEEELMKLSGIMFSFDVYTKDGSKKLGTYIYNGEDKTFTEVKEADELNIVKEIYTETTGKKWVHKKWYEHAAWHYRLYCIVNREPCDISKLWSK